MQRTSDGLTSLEWVFKALSYRKRLEIMGVLIAEGTMSVGDIAERTESSLWSTSRNLGVLAKAGLISSCKTHVTVQYHVKRAGCSRENRMVLALVRRAVEPPGERQELLDAVLDDLLSGTHKRTMARLVK